MGGWGIIRMLEFRGGLGVNQQAS
jgi:hypothetical protein